MSRRPANITQADIARAIRAAKKVGWSTTEYYHWTPNRVLAAAIGVGLAYMVTKWWSR